MNESGFTHLDARGHANMVDVSGKQPTWRTAVAACRVTMSCETAARLGDGSPESRSIFDAARVAGIQAAKQTAYLIPLCHQLLLDSVEVALEAADGYVEITVEVRTFERTGVEIEALTAGGVAALALYDMCKATDATMQIDELTVWEKRGGRSGTWRREQGGGVTHS